MVEPLPAADEGAARDALLAAACLAVDPCGVGGAWVRTDFGAACRQWLEALCALLPDEHPLRRMPAHIDDERLLGGIDLAATLAAGAPVRARGLLAEAGGGVIALGSAERLPVRLAAALAAALDRREVALVALDGSLGEDEPCARVLADRLGLAIDLRDCDERQLQLMDGEYDADDVQRARQRLREVATDDESLRILCATAAACGIASLHAPLLALRVARAHAALAGRRALVAADLEAAARLVLAPRAACMPAASAQESGEPPPPEPNEPESDATSQPEPTGQVGELADQVVAAARAAIPARLLASLAAAAAGQARVGTAGKSGAIVLRGRRGRPCGVRAGTPRGGTRLNIVATLRAAAPWQRVRRREASPPARLAPQARRVLVRAEDFRVTCFRQRSETITLFLLDASGSSAMHRLAEVKGAVELLLGECYVRRDQVAVIAFRGRKAELVLAPTRSLVRAKRSLAGLPGGGGTPLATALDAARELATQSRRRGLDPSLVVLTDGQANVARDGSGGRQRAAEEALQAARALRAGGFRTLLIDTAPRPQPQARALAECLCARYLPLPYADARALAGAVQSAG